LNLVRRYNPRGGYQLLNLDQMVRMEVRNEDGPDTTVTATFAGEISAHFTGESARRLLARMNELFDEPLSL
jgi:hypothetical protein